MNQRQTPSRTEDERVMCAATILLFVFTAAFWDRAILVLQSLAVGLSTVYCFFCGIGIFKLAKWLGEISDTSPPKVAASLWLVFFFAPTITQIVLPSDIIARYSLGFFASIADRAVMLAKVAVFVYGFGHVILLFLGWFIIDMAKDPRSKDSPYSWFMVMYILTLGMLTFFVTLQMAAATWYPEWIPSVNDVSILRVVWLSVFVTGLVVEGLLPEKVKAILSITGQMPSNQRILMVAGFFLALQPGYLLFLDPTLPFLFFFYPSSEILGIMFFVGLAFMAYSILGFMSEETAHDE